MCTSSHYLIAQFLRTGVLELRLATSIPSINAAATNSADADDVDDDADDVHADNEYDDNDDRGLRNLSQS